MRILMGEDIKEKIVLPKFVHKVAKTAIARAQVIAFVNFNNTSFIKCKF